MSTELDRYGGADAYAAYDGRQSLERERAARYGTCARCAHSYYVDNSCYVNSAFARSLDGVAMCGKHGESARAVIGSLCEFVSRYSMFCLCLLDPKDPFEVDPGTHPEEINCDDYMEE